MRDTKRRGKWRFMFTTQISPRHRSVEQEVEREKHLRKRAANEYLLFSDDVS